VEANVTFDARTPAPAQPTCPWAAQARVIEWHTGAITGFSPTDKLQLLLLTEHRKHIKELLEYPPDGDESMIATSNHHGTLQSRPPKQSMWQGFMTHHTCKSGCINS
jgi:hypothetical protein